MKKTKLKILFTALGFLALSSAFSQDTTNMSTTPGDSLNNSVPQASPMATDSTNASTQTWSSDSTSANSSVTEGQSKADKKREKAMKKEEKAIKKEEKAGQ
jgi:hypothetical protein